MKVFKNIEDVLGEGRFIIKVFPADKWDGSLNEGQGGFAKGVQQTVAVKGGKTAYKYNVESVVRNGNDERLRYDNGEGKEYRCSVLAFDEKSKAILDTGTAEINIIPKLNSDKEEIFSKRDGEFVKELRFFINPLPRVGVDTIDNNGDGSTKLWKAPKEFVEDEVPTIEDGNDILDPDYIDPDTIPL